MESRTGVLLKMSFTIWARLRPLLRSSSKRGHLLRTWRWSLGQAWRAVSGVQVTEVLQEMKVLASGLVPSLTLPQVPSFTDEEFLSLAAGVGAGKMGHHRFAYGYLDLVAAEVTNVLEIGIGTTNLKKPSNMGSSGSPGASLELWASLFPSASVTGADVDPESFVFQKRVRSLHVDSTSEESLLTLRKGLEKQAPLGMDLIVDDGLHTPEANLRNFRVLIPLLRRGGFYVIEDIPHQWLGFWALVGSGLESFDWRVVAPEVGKGGFLVLRRG